MITYTRATLDIELEQILAIQQRNVKDSASEEERIHEGFITVGHTFEILKKMNNACPHIIAKDGDQVVGYALVMLQTFRDELPILIPMFKAADRLLADKDYAVMGQIAIDKPYRRQGIFKGLYNYYRESLKDSFDCLFTEVATNNKRSLEAHKAVGFKVLETQITDKTSWELINWDW